MLALLWWATLATKKFGWSCSWNWRSCYCSPTVVGLTKFDLLQLTQGCFQGGLWLTRGARLPLISLTSSRGAMWDFFLKSCNHVKGLFWVLWGLARGDIYFGMRIILVAVLVRSATRMVFFVWIPECLWDRSGLIPGLWVQNIII